MTLNSYRNEARDFMQRIGALDDEIKLKINWLEEEFKLLKNAVNTDDHNKIRHQVYDMLFILFEISADCNSALDEEWGVGRERKQAKYFDKNS